MTRYSVVLLRSVAPLSASTPSFLCHSVYTLLLINHYGNTQYFPLFLISSTLYWSGHNTTPFLDWWIPDTIKDHPVANSFVQKPLPSMKCDTQLDCLPLMLMRGGVNTNTLFRVHLTGHEVRWSVDYTRPVCDSRHRKHDRVFPM